MSSSYYYIAPPAPGLIAYNQQSPSNNTMLHHLPRHMMLLPPVQPLHQLQPYPSNAGMVAGQDPGYNRQQTIYCDICHGMSSLHLDLTPPFIRREDSMEDSSMSTHSTPSPGCGGGEGMVRGGEYMARGGEGMIGGGEGMARGGEGMIGGGEDMARGGEGIVRGGEGMIRGGEVMVRGGEGMIGGGEVMVRGGEGMIGGGEGMVRVGEGMIGGGEGMVRVGEGMIGGGDGMIGGGNKKTRRTKRAGKGDGAMYCKICKDSGLPSDVYYGHSLRSSEGEVVCPQLLEHVCPTCGQKGQHTRKYCPLYPNQKKRKLQRLFMKTNQLIS